MREVTVTYHGDDSGRPTSPGHPSLRKPCSYQQYCHYQYHTGGSYRDCQLELAALWRSRSLDCIQDVTPESSPPLPDLRRKSICVSRLNEPILGRERGAETIHSSRAGSLSYYRHKKRKCFIEHGFVELALEKMVTRHYGEETWQEIKGISTSRMERTDLLTGMFTDEQLTYDVIEATAQVVGCQKSKILEMFGEMFFEFCGESGYDKILQVLGGTLMEFLQNLDALHDHLATIYPGMKTPSFRCMEREDGSMVLYFSTERAGLEHVVLGLVKSAARELHGKDVTVTIIAATEDSKSHNFQFLVEETIPTTDCLSPVAYKLSDGVSDYGGLIGSQQFISPSDFCQFLPFHFMFNRRLRITQNGNVIARVIPEVEDGYLPDIFVINRPDIVMSFDDIRQHSSTVFVLSARHEPLIYRENRMRARTPDLIRIPEPRLRPRTPDPVAESKKETMTTQGRRSLPSEETPGVVRGDTPKMRLRGQMLYLPECDEILFLCSPYVSNLEELHERGLYLSDLPVHDATRDLILLSEQFRAEYELTQRLELMTQRLQQTYKELEIEKQLTDKLVYSILPPSVANKLRQGHAVEAVKYDMVTILFSGLCDFDQICCNNSPIAIVNLLNDLYTKFDMLADPKVNNVYKVETAGDKYLVASGLPERNTTHARNIALLALDMMEVAREIRIDSGGTVRLCIGVHSGPAVAGVIGQKLPRFCVFGDTVNIASRMETTGLPNKINISEITYKLILEQDPDSDTKFAFTERGPLSIKGKSKPIVTYILYRKSRVIPALQALLEHGLVVGDRGSPPLELLQQRRRSEGTCRYHDASRMGRRLSCIPPSSKSKSTLDVPKVLTDANGRLIDANGPICDAGTSSDGSSC